MEQLEKEKRVLQWHPAFVAGLQIEFENEIAKMHFESEYQLGCTDMLVFTSLML